MTEYNIFKVTYLQGTYSV